MEDLKGFRRVVLPRNNARDLGFMGKLLAGNIEEVRLVNLSRHQPEPETNPDDAIVIAALFQLMSGKYVCFLRRLEDGEFTFDVRILQPDQVWQVEEFFLARGAAGKQLLTSWGVNIVEEIE